MMMNFIKTYWVGLLVFAFVIGCAGYNIHSSHQKELEKVRKELEKEKNERRKQHINDSIKATPAYIDSVRKSDEMFHAWEKRHNSIEEEELVGFVHGNDTIYHSTFHPIHEIPDDYLNMFANFMKSEENELRFVSKAEAKKYGLKECRECEEINLAFLEYENGDLIRREDARDYVDDYDY